MKTMAKFLTILLALLAGISFAGTSLSFEETASSIKPIGFTCGETNGGESPYDYECSIRQTISDSVPVFTMRGWTFSSTWKDFVEKLDSHLMTGEGNADGINIYFESDIDLGGYGVDQYGDTVCAESGFAPLSFASVTNPVHIDGNNHLIKNFCYITGYYTQAALINGNNVSSIEKLKMENAYVKLKEDKQTTSISYIASILVYETDNVTLSDIEIKNSRLSVSATAGTVMAGGLIGYVKSSNRTVVKNSVVEVDIDVVGTPTNTFAGNLFGYIDASSGETNGAFDVIGTISKGDLRMVSKDDVDESKVFLGYIAGSIAYVSMASKILSNYHLGEKDVDVSSAFGAFKKMSDEGTPVDVTNWREGYPYDFVRYNYRNTVKDGDETLSADGTLNRFLGNGSVIHTVTSGGLTTKEVWYNAVLDDSIMKTRLFTYTMNKGSNGNLVYWENGEDGYLELTDYCTAYRAVVNINAIYESLSETEKEDLADYLYEGTKLVLQMPTPDYNLVAYTNKDARLDSDFVKKVQDLKVDFGITRNAAEIIDVDDWNVTGNDSAVAVPNRSFEVVYEAMDPSAVANVEYVSLESVLQDPIYVWPKVNNVKLFGSHNVIPPVISLMDGGVDEYSLYYAYVECGEEALSTCNDAEFRPDPGTHDFAKIFSKIFDQLSSVHSNTLHLVYAVSEGSIPMVTFVSGNERSTIKVVEHAYDKDGKLFPYDTAVVETIEDETVERRIMPRYTMGVERGFVLKKWTVDFWASYNWDASTMEDCYADEYDLPEECANVWNHVGVSPYIMSVDSFVRAADGFLKSGAAKWSFEMDVADTLNVDSLALAIASSPYGSSDLSLHFHLTPVMEAIPYTVSFKMNADESTVFLDDEMVYSGFVYSREREEMERFPSVYRIDACFEGWGNKAEEPGIITSVLNAALLDTINPTDSSFSLYAQWIQVEENAEVCSHIEESVIALKVVDKDGEQGDLGTLALWQSYGYGENRVKLNHEFTDLGILKDFDLGNLIPWTENEGATASLQEKFADADGMMMIPMTLRSMPFSVASTPKEGYALAKLSLVTVRNAATNEVNDRDSVAIPFYHSDTTFSIWPRPEEEYWLYAMFGRVINVALDLGKDSKDVFYGPYSKLDTLKVVESGSVSFPEWIYTSDACVLGWAVQKNAKDYDYSVMDSQTESDSLLDKLGEGRTLYALWGDADKCVEEVDYNRIRLVTAHGTIQLIETTADEADVQYVHSFAEDSTMLLPVEIFDSYFVVKAVPDSGYVLDRLVIEVRNEWENKFEEEEKNFVHREDSLVRFDGDTLPSYLMDAVLTAYFSEAPVEPDADSLELVVHEFAQSGNAVQLTVATNEFNAKRSAKLQISLMDAQGNVLEDYGFAEEVKKTPYEHVWTQYPLLPGRYVVKATLSDKVDTVAFDTAFTVRSEIEVAGDAWQMLSLADVEVDSIVLDGDPLFYRWDESASFGDFWKYQKYRGGDVEAEQGFWYSSLSGRALPLRPDSAVSGDEIEWALDSGWNLVANPYGWNIWLNDTDSLELYKWSTEHADYWSMPFVEAYEAVWIYSDSKKTVIFASEPNFDNVADLVEEYELHLYEYEKDNQQGLTKKALAKAASRDNWTLQAVLSDTKGHRDSWNVIGAGAAAEQPEPPEGMGDHVNLSLLEGKRALAKSIRSADEASYEWNMALSATGDRVGYLKFEGVKALNEMGLKVFVTVDGKTTEALAGDSLKVLLKTAGSTATVRVAPMDARALASKVENLRFEQASGRLQVGFDVSEGLAGANYVVQLVGLNGKIAASYGSKAFFGHNTVALNVPKSGIYLLRVRVGSEQATRKVAISR